MSLDDKIQAANPDLAPSEAMVTRHRGELDHAIAARSDTGIAVEVPPAVVELVTPRTAVPLRRKPLAPVLAAVFVVAAGAVGVFAIARSGQPAIVVETDPAGSGDNNAVQPSPSSAGSTVEPAPLRCGDKFPFEVEFPTLDSDLVAGPLPDSTPDPDQLVAHATGVDRSVEFRWPATQRARRGAPQDSMAESISGTAQRPDLSDDASLPVVDLYLASDAQKLFRDPDAAQPFARFRSMQYTGADPVCSTFEIRLVEPTGRASAVLVGLDTNPNDDNAFSGVIGDNNPVVIETRTQADIPTETLTCDSGGSDGTEVQSNVDRPITGGPVRPDPIDALVAFLAGPDGEQLHQSGYIEFLAPDSSITYARPFESPNSGYVTVIDLTPVDGGWTATHLRTPGC